MRSTEFKRHLEAVFMVSTSLILAGCATPGANLQANVYKAGQVNQAQDVKTVTIISITPAQVEVDNSQNKKTAEVLGGLLGAAGGGVLGNNVTKHSTAGTVVGVAGGGVGGAAVGSLVPDTTLAEGVTLVYKDDKNKLHSSTQVGQACDYQAGTAMIISTGPNETRIQANTSCPVPAK